MMLCLLFLPISHLLPVTGILKGYDQLLNLVLDEVEEEFQGLYALPILALVLNVLQNHSRISGHWVWLYCAGQQ